MREETPLEHALRHCSLPALILLTSKTLSRAGYGDIQILDRRHSKQKSRYGGHELVCTATFATVTLKVIVKVIADSVRTRMVDELAGAVMRNGADFGIIVTSKHISRNARMHQEGGVYKTSRVETIDCKSLSALLLKFAIGTRGDEGVDYAFFGELEEVADRVDRFLREESL